LALPNGIPSDDTFRRVFEFIDPEALNQCFLHWVETKVTKMAGEIIPIDGKTIRASYDRNQGKSALHLISAWSSTQRLVLAQMKVEDKSHEITAIPALLEFWISQARLSPLMLWGHKQKLLIRLSRKKVIIS